MISRPNVVNLSPIEFLWCCAKQLYKISQSQQLDEFVAEPCAMTQTGHRLPPLGGIICNHVCYCNIVENILESLIYLKLQ